MILIRISDFMSRIRRLKIGAIKFAIGHHINKHNGKLHQC